MLFPDSKALAAEPWIGKFLDYNYTFIFAQLLILRYRVTVMLALLFLDRNSKKQDLIKTRTTCGKFNCIVFYLIIFGNFVFSEHLWNESFKRKSGYFASTVNFFISS